MPVEFVYSTAHNKESEAVVTFLGTTGWMAGSDFDLTPVSELNIVKTGVTVLYDRGSEVQGHP